ncbi:DoxX family protein [Streptomyces qinzhouensis]|uniref:DoxX family protein n=2 Tax=Streptomyces qinzhouensis TaxID=2599401 RepID=A0A5B8JLC9_9ACTN|nr:DoxX family protein [Streptomyces qinzhouensis]
MVLALLFAAAGAMKVALSQEALLPLMPWVDAVPMAAVRGIGALEVLGAAGLVLPALWPAAAPLLPLAAGGLALLMAGGGALHISRGEYAESAGNAVVLALAVLVTRCGPGPHRGRTGRLCGARTG